MYAWDRCLSYDIFDFYEYQNVQFKHLQIFCSELKHNKQQHQLDGQWRRPSFSNIFFVFSKSQAFMKKGGSLLQMFLILTSNIVHCTVYNVFNFLLAIKDKSIPERKHAQCWSYDVRFLKCQQKTDLIKHQIA